MIRYLMHTSYIGTTFKGVNMIESFYRFGDLRMIQGVLEYTIRSTLKQKCPVGYAGRTDARVHALSTYFEFDYENKENQPIDKQQLLGAINEKLMQINAAIRVNSIEQVDRDIFQAHRNVRRRGYLYRIAVRKPNDNFSSDAILPIEEVDRCFFIDSQQFSIDKVTEAARLFLGKHDFRSFMKWSPEVKTQSGFYSQRTLLSLKVTPGRPCVTSYNLPLCEQNFQFYDIHFKGISFIYRQIRRIVGVLCAVGEGRITNRHVYEMLTIPNHEMWTNLRRQNLIKEAPACGLYLSRISYYPIEECTLKKNITPRGMKMRSFVSPNKHGI